MKPYRHKVKCPKCGRLIGLRENGEFKTHATGVMLRDVCWGSDTKWKKAK